MQSQHIWDTRNVGKLKVSQLEIDFNQVIIPISQLVKNFIRLVIDLIQLIIYIIPAIIAFGQLMIYLEELVRNFGQFLLKQFKSNPLRSNDLQAHWARAKRQQHLPKELVRFLKVQQYLSFIRERHKDATWLTPKLCGVAIS